MVLNKLQSCLEPKLLLKHPIYRPKERSESQRHYRFWGLWPGVKRVNLVKRVIERDKKQNAFVNVVRQNLLNITETVATKCNLPKYCF